MENAVMRLAHLEETCEVYVLYLKNFGFILVYSASYS